MPKGTVKNNPTYGKPMILAEDGRWIFLPDGSDFALETAITFTEWTKPGVTPPPGIYHATDVQAEVKKGPTAWGGTFKPSFSQEDLERMSTRPTTGGVTATAAAPAPAPTRFIDDETAEADYRLIKTAVNRMNWSGDYGPSVRVQTKLKWENPPARQLYLKIKEELHDQPIPGTKLYYYVTGLGVSWGKAGFRITGHTKPSGQVEKSTTQGVLHIEND